MKHYLELKTGDKIFLKCFSDDSQNNWSLYHINISLDVCNGDGINEECFEFEKTGYESEEK